MYLSKNILCLIIGPQEGSIFALGVLQGDIDLNNTTQELLLGPFNYMMRSSNGNVFRVTVHLFGEFIGHRWIPAQRPVTRSVDVFFDLRLNKRLSKRLRLVISDAIVSITTSL